ncbi:hypothetical protein Hanom_Chr16g01440191 [Helianthus anomalus]
MAYFLNFHLVLPDLPLFNEVPMILQCFFWFLGAIQPFPIKCDHQFMQSNRFYFNAPSVSSNPTY